MRTKTETALLPMLAVKGLVVFPNTVVHFDISKERSELSLKSALNENRLIFLDAQIDNTVDDPVKKDLHQIGTVAEIRQIVKTSDQVTRVLVEGRYRAKLIKIEQKEPFLTALIKKLPNSIRCQNEDVETDAVMRAAKTAFEQYLRFVPRMPKDLINGIMNETDPAKFFDVAVSNLPLPAEDKQDLLEEDYLVSRLGMLLAMISRETEVLDLESSIQNKVREQIDDSQREYYLREQMRAISSQLGEDDFEDEIDEYEQKIKELSLSQENEEKLLREVTRMSKMSPSSQDYAVLRNYLDTVLELPWNKYSDENIDINAAQDQLDGDHYGLKKVKERIVENIAVRVLKPDVKGQIICLVGPPGVGKTSIGKSIAKALGREYVRVSLGGIRDESDIRGHRKTYVGAMPGRIITALKQAGTANPLILLDEIDKMSKDMRGDPSSAMLEVLDGEQNNSFRDHYIEIPFDLSKVVFVTTANTTDTIDPPLLDRMEVIELTSYNREEKFHIAKEYLIPKQLKANGLRASMLKIADGAVYELIDSYSREAGVRKLERLIASLCRKTAKKIVAGEGSRVSVTSRNIEDFLGARKYLDDEISKKDLIGVVNGLAWTSVGGVIMPLEAIVMNGKGDVEVTGSLGDVMKESSKIAVSYVRSVADKYGIADDFYKEKDIHIHAPEGAVPKDGPSAGVTMTTALVSALSGIPVRHDVAMTGEITLHGNVLPIGGLREKTMAAYKAGMKDVIIPARNKSDLEEVDEVVKDSLNFVYAETLTDVLEHALLKKTAPTVKKKRQKKESRAEVRV